MISITTLNIEINIMPIQGRRPVDTTKFSLGLKGYPSIDSITIDSLDYKSGEDLDIAFREDDKNA